MLQAVRKTAIVGVLMGLVILAVDSVSAASISTRVRILEKKVRKHDREIRANSYALKQQRKKMSAVSADIQRLSGRVDQLEKALKAIKKPKEDKRYSYP